MPAFKTAHDIEANNNKPFYAVYVCDYGLYFFSESTLNRTDLLLCDNRADLDKNKDGRLDSIFTLLKTIYANLFHRKQLYFLIFKDSEHFEAFEAARNSNPSRAMRHLFEQQQHQQAPQMSSCLDRIAKINELDRQQFEARPFRPIPILEEYKGEHLTRGNKEHKIKMDAELEIIVAKIDALTIKLNAYAEQFERGGSYDFEKGFSIFTKSRGLNRQLNVETAIALSGALDSLKNECVNAINNPLQHINNCHLYLMKKRIAEILNQATQFRATAINEKNANTHSHSRFLGYSPCTFFNASGINSSTLNNIIKEGLTVGKTSRR